MKKQIKITEIVIQELSGVKIAKYLLSVGQPYKEIKTKEEKNVG
jgi:hypothetical protein